MDHKDLIRATECCDLKDCEDCPSKGRVCCRERTMQELAALKNEILRAEAAEADNERLREAIKPNCLMCESMHPDNGNCTEVGGFCTAVLAAHCPMIPRLRERAEAAEARAEKAEKERDVYKEMIYKERPCAFCAGHTGEWSAECVRCDNCIMKYRPKFRLRELEEE